MHSHILYGVDDGPTTLEESIELLEKAVEEGITGIISTSHAKHPQFHVDGKTVQEQLKQLEKEIAERNLPLKLYKGHEIRLHETLENSIHNGELFKLADSKYILLELPSHHVPLYTSNIVNELLSNQIIPIIAHPERNKGIVEKPERLARLVRQGAIAQITSGSLCGHFGRNIQKSALQLVDAHLVHTIGSDVHNLTKRPFLFDKGLTYLEKHGRSCYANLFLENNERIILNSDVILLDPEILKKKSWWRIKV